MRTTVLAAQAARRALLGVFVLCAALAPVPAWATATCDSFNSGLYDVNFRSGTTFLISVLNQNVGDVINYNWSSQNSATPYLWAQNITYVTGVVPGSGTGSGSFVPTVQDWAISYGNNGQGGTAYFTFSCIPIPTITSLNLTSGPASGGTTVTVTGKDFLSGATVLVDGVAASNVTVIGKTSLTFVAPTHAVGTVDLKITNTGGRTATKSGAYTYYASSDSTLSSLSATAGPVAGGTYVSATGTGFVAGSTSINIGGTIVDAANVTVNSPTSLSFVTPAHAAGNVNVMAVLPDGTTDPVAGGFTYLAAPTSTNMTPTSGPPAGGTKVTVLGSGYLSGQTTVTIGGTVIPAGSVTVSNGSLLNFNTPAHAPGNVAVTVSTAGGTSTAVSGGFTYTGPTASSMSPNSGPAQGGTSVTVTGTGFVVGGTSVTVGSKTVPSGSVTVSSATSLSFVMPSGSPGPAAVTVTTSGGTSDPIPDGYTYVGPPAVNAISPSSGPTTGGTQVVITGGGDFNSPDMTVKFGTIAASYVVNDLNQITATSPAGNAGTVDITISTPFAGTSVTSAASKFTYVAAPTAANLSLQVPPGVATPIDLSASITGSHTSIEVTVRPAYGNATVDGDTVIFTPVTGFTGYDLFKYKVIGVGGNSEVATVNLNVQPSAQTITFDALPNASLSASPLTLSATASSGQPVSFTSTTTDVCTVSDTALTLLKIGICSIDAKQAGGGQWAAAPTVSHSFTVTPATLTITTGTVSGASVGATFSQANTAAGGVAPYSYQLASGQLPAGLTLSASDGTVSGSPTSAGSYSYSIKATDSQATPVSITGTPVSGTIAKGDQTISFTSSAPTSATAGSASYTLSATASSGLTVSFSRDGSSTGCELSGATVTFAGTGTCVIDANQAGSSDWNPASQAQQSFTVGQAGAITATASFSTSSLAVGATGTLTLTLTNPNATSTPWFDGYITGPSLLSYVIASKSGNCTGGSTVGDVEAMGLQSISVPPGSCTMTLRFTGETVGSSSGFNFRFDTPTGYAQGSDANSGSLAVVPSVTGISPNSGPVSQVVTISGTGFSSTLGNNTVSFGSAGAGTVTAASANSLTVTAPASGSGAVSVTVTVNGQTSAGSATYTFIGKPSAADKTVDVPYAGSAEIDLSSLITGGPHSSILIGTQPAHGTTSITGDTITYTPAATYYGADSFTWAATGTGGTSNYATVTLNVAVPSAPVGAAKSGVAIPYNSTGTPIDLAGSITGVHSSIALGSGPSHGGVSISGDTITYTPTAGYFGADSFTYTATGPGGTSVPATVSLTVATPGAPVAADKSNVAVAYGGSATEIDLTASVTGVSTGIALGSNPTHGTVTFSGYTASYTPSPTYYGADSFTYVANGPGGASAPATVSVTVATPPAPVAAAKSGVAVAYNSSGTKIDLSGSVTGVHSSIALGSGPIHGGVSISGDTITYTPTAGYFGADSFTYTATGPGGTSAPATVSLTVATPAAPVAGDKSNVAVAYGGSATEIDLTASVTGVSTGIALGSNPAHGTVSFSGYTASYTPSPTYYGADSFTYVANGPGGTSSPATVSVTVATPAAPVASDKTGLSVPYNSASMPIDLSGSITGVHSGIAIGTPPAHGSMTISGDTVSYTPTSGYYGADGFTYYATGPGGNSSIATAGLTVATPAAPVASDKTSVSVPYNSTSVPIDLSGSIAGVHSGITIGTQPEHGSVTITGDVVTYTPTSGYYGSDSFTYYATGPGGDSPAATVSLTVATPPAPTVASGTSTVAGRTTSADGSVQINLSELVSGVYGSIEIETPPAHGTVTLSGGSQSPAGRSTAAVKPPVIATYTPAVGFAGIDSFAFVAVGPGGTSSPATMAITVVGTVPTAQPKTAKTGDGQLVSVMLTEGAVGGPFTGAHVVSITPQDSATTAIVASGTGESATYRLDITPNNRFGGTIVVSYTLSNTFGDSAPATVTLTVEARPDPRTDPNVAAISDAQAEATRRFARAQVSNFMRRTEQLHNGGGRSGMAMGVTLGSTDRVVVANPANQEVALGSTAGMRLPGLSDGSANPAQAPGRAAPADGYKPAGGGNDGQRQTGSLATWVGGAIDIGTRDATTTRSKISATTAGLSGGIDIKLSDDLLVGVGGGYGDDTSRIGTDAQVRSHSSIYAAYASFQPTGDAFLDGMIGRGQLHFATRRLVEAVDSVATGQRGGDYTVAALSVGIDRTSGPLQWSLYGRGEYMDASLDAYVEDGADRYNLRFDERGVESLTGTLGGMIQYRRKTGYGAFTPRLRAEWNHEFADVDSQWLDYADIPSAAIYELDGNGWRREQFQITAGARFDILKGGWSVDLEGGLRAAAGEKAATLQTKLSKQF